MYSCVRGIYNTQPDVHETTEVQQLITSDHLSQPITGQVKTEESTAGAFLLNLLDGDWGNSDYAINLPDNLVKQNSFVELSQNTSLNFDGIFQRLIFPDECYRDVVADICKSLNIYMYINKDGQIDIGNIKPQLKHNPMDITINQTDFVKAPQIFWREDLRINRTKFYLDYNCIDENYNTSVIMEDQSLPANPLTSNNDLTFELKSRCIRTRSQQGTYGEGFYYDFAWAIIKQFNRPLTEVRVSVLPSVAEDIEILSLVKLNTGILPSGNGKRGISENYYNVVEVEKNISDNITNLTLLEKGSNVYGGIAPCLTISAYNSSTKTMMVSKNNYWDDNLNPADIFISGTNIILKYMGQLSAGTYTESETLVIDTDGVDFSNWFNDDVGFISLTANPSTLPSSGDIIVGTSYGNNTDKPVEDFVFLADDDGFLNLTEEPYYYSY